MSGVLIAPMMRFDKATVSNRPFPHVLKDGALDSEAYRALLETFPSCPPGSGPTGFSLFWGDEDYDRLLREQPVWKAFFDTFHCQAFVDYAVEQFREAYARDGCTIGLDQARYVPYCEDRIDKENRHLRKLEHEPHELWVRVDTYQGKTGYSRQMHLDWRRRLMTTLIYFCDADEIDLEGGELVLHGPRYRFWQRPVMVVPRHNRMVMFPCSRESWHSVPVIRSLKAPRSYVQVHVSSSVNAWR